MSALRSHASTRSYDLTRSDFDRIAQILKERAGITLTEGGQKLVVSRLTRHLDQLNLPNFKTYVTHLSSPAGEQDAWRMVDLLTTNTTRFFREPEHFEIVEKQAMPRLIQKARTGGRVRMWSAACSSGEEPYSLAATVISAFPDAPRHDIKILATDISHDMLKKAQAGLYEPRLAEDLCDTRKRLLFEGTTTSRPLSIRHDLRQLVSFRYLNFVEPWPVTGPFDVIFCRNVAIYMDQPTQTRLWVGLERVLDPQGLLFIGHSERIAPELLDRLTLFATTAFRRPFGAPEIRKET